MKNWENHIYTLFDLGIRKIYVKIHGNQSRRLAVIMRSSLTCKMLKLQPKTETILCLVKSKTFM